METDEGSEEINPHGYNIFSLLTRVAAMVVAYRMQNHCMSLMWGRRGEGGGRGGVSKAFAEYVWGLLDEAVPVSVVVRDWTRMRGRQAQEDNIGKAL